MDCYVHSRPAVGVCALCGRGVCRDCLIQDSPHLICHTCEANPPTQGFEYRSGLEIAGLPFIHICAGVHPLTKRPRVAKGVIAIGNIAVGGLAIGGLSIGLLTLGGMSIGILGALGGAALGVGVSVGGLAVGWVAIGGVALGFAHAIGGAAFAPHVVSALRCDPETAALFQPMLDRLGIPPLCRY
jgi:hypothetical protein